MGKKRRAVIIITEGVSFKLLREFMGEGYLPGFVAFFEQAAWGDLDSHTIPYEPPGLMTAFTGVSSSEHRWFSYWTVHEPDHIPRVLTSNDVHIKPFWMRPEYRHAHFSIINVLGTHPPMAVPGELISYPMTQTLRASYPPDLLLTLLKQGLPYSQDHISVWYKGQSKNDFCSKVLEADRRRIALVKHFYAQGADVVIVNLTTIDRTCHYYWQELEPGSQVDRHDSAILAAYQCADDLITYLLNSIDDQTSLFTFSEIGFGPLKAYISVNEVLAKAGFLKWKQPGIEVEWNATMAAESVQGSSGININLVGRYDTAVVRATDYEKVRADVSAVLRAAINPYTGLNLFADVLPREAVYEGGGVEYAPDLVLYPKDQRYLPLGDPFWALHVNRNLQSGWHRNGSYWAALGPEIASGERSETASLLQILPAVEEMLGMGSNGRHPSLFAETCGRHSLECAR